MSKIIELEYTGETLADATAGDIVEFVNDGRLFVVQGFVDDRAVIAHIDRYKLCFSEGLRAVDYILNNLLCDYDIAPGAYDNFKVVYPRDIGG